MDRLGLLVIGTFFLLLGIPGIGPWGFSLLGVVIFFYSCSRNSLARNIVSSWIFLGAYGFVVLHPFFEGWKLFGGVTLFSLLSVLPIMSFWYSDKRVFSLTPLFTALGWVSMEYLRTCALGGLPLGVLGIPLLTSFSNVPFLGMYAASALLVFLGSLPKIYGSSLRRKIITLRQLFVASLSASLVFFGLTSIEVSKAVPISRSEGRIAIVGHAYSEAAEPQQVANEYFEAIRTARERNSSLIILPGQVLSQGSGEEEYLDVLEEKSQGAPDLLYQGQNGVYLFVRGNTTLLQEGIFSTSDGISFQICQNKEACVVGNSLKTIAFRNDRMLNTSYGREMSWAIDRITGHHSAATFLRSSYGGISAVIVNGEMRETLSGTGILFVDL